MNGVDNYQLAPLTGSALDSGPEGLWRALAQVRSIARRKAANKGATDAEPFLRYATYIGDLQKLLARDIRAGRT